MKRLIKGFLFAAAFIGNAALADNNIFLVQPDTFEQQFADTLRRNRGQMERAGAQLGVALAAFAHRNDVVKVVVVVQCERFVRAATVSRSGEVKQIPADEPVDRPGLALAQATYPQLQVIELSCDH